MLLLTFVNFPQFQTLSSTYRTNSFSSSSAHCGTQSIMSMHEDLYICTKCQQFSIEQLSQLNITYAISFQLINILWYVFFLINTQCIFLLSVFISTKSQIWFFKKVLSSRFCIVCKQLTGGPASQTGIFWNLLMKLYTFKWRG